MKKLVLIAAIAGVAAANSANAATLYNDKGLKYSLKGDWQVQMRQDIGSEQEMQVEFDDLELKNVVAYDLGDGMTAFGQLHHGFKNQADAKTVKLTDESIDKGPHLEEAFVGLDFGMFAFAMGKMDYASEDFGVEAAKEEKTVDTYAMEDDAGDDVLHFAFDLETVLIEVSHELASDSESSGSAESTDILVTGETAGVEYQAMYQTYAANPDADSITTMGVAVSYDLGMAKLGLDYSDRDGDANDDGLTVINFLASIKAGKTAKVNVGMIQNDFEEDGADSITETYVNYIYKFPTQKNVRLFVEVADSDKDDTDMGYLAGLRLKF